MKIEEHFLKRMTLEGFADQHGLVMEVHERGQHPSPSRFYARFKGVEISDRGMLISTFGNGCEPEIAMRAYAKEISEKVIVVGAFTSDRREIVVPILDTSDGGGGRHHVNSTDRVGGCGTTDPEAAPEEPDPYMDLIMQVARKFPGETRHQTARRYIVEAEAHTGGGGSEAKQAQEQQAQEQP